MIDVKINASFILPGSVLPAESLSTRKRGKKEKKEEKEKQDNQILYRQEKIRLPKEQSIVINLREAKPAKQVIHLSLDAYNYMIESPVQGVTAFHWKNLSKNKRIKAHLEEMATSLGGKLESFVILED